MASRDTPEYLAVKRHLVALKDAVLRGQIPAVLFQEDVISEDTFCKATNNTMGRDERGNGTMVEVLQSLRLDPAGVFDKLCGALAESKCAKDIADKMRATHAQLKESSEEHDTEDFEKLKRQLEALKLTLDSASNSKIELATIDCFKDAIQQYIERGLRANNETCYVKNDIERLCRVYLVIPTALWGWSMQEVGKAAEKLASERSCVPKPLVKKVTPPPSLFSKDTLYHACLCCEAISSSTNNSLSFFQCKRPQHSLTEVSFSQSRDGAITPYLIARQRDVIYVTFRSNLCVSEWIKSASSFEEGLRQQSYQIPLSFFRDELINNKKIVFTGFSFGGMLACCVSARLWHSTIDRQCLLQRVICITFGQPFLQMKMVEEESRICPQFMESIYSVFSKKDIVPLLFSFLNLEESKHPVSLGMYHKTKALVGPDNVLPKPTSTPEVGGLFHIPFIKTFLQNLAELQKYQPQSKVTPKMKSATKELSDALRRIVICQDAVTLYGNCYVMSHGSRGEGLLWQQQAKQLAAIELNQHPKFVADQLSERLFEEHTANCYMIKVARSYLEKEEKYILPNEGQATNLVTEVDALKPKLNGIQIHDYPTESVIVVQGENLWFSYKVCLDERGPNHHEFIATAESTTQYMIEFRSENSPDVGASKQVKLTLFTHFASPIRQTMIAVQEPHEFSPRQVQMAKYTPSQVIKLAYICALLEQKHHQSGKSKRFKAIAFFLNEAVKVVPLESIFRAIAYQKYEIALECAEALKKRKLNLHASQLMIMGALKASIRAHLGYEGELIDQLLLPPVVPIHHMLISAKWWLQTIQRQGSQTPSQQFSMQAIPLQVEVFQSSVLQHNLPPTQNPSVPSRMSDSSTPQKKYSEAVVGGQSQQQESPKVQATQIMAVPFPFPIFVDPHIRPSLVPFPPHIMKFLAKCLHGLIEQTETHQCFEFGTDLCVVTTANISDVYSISPKKSAYFRSPLQVLSDGLKKISTFTDIIEADQASPGTQLPNEQMLKILDKIFEEDVTICASLLGAFMEQQIRIPLIHTAKITAETLLNTAPVAVGVWALFSQNCDTLKAKLESNNQSKLIVEIREYIEGISQQLPQNEDRMYAGKLQFLLQGMQEIVTASNQYISYSLEHQLCRNLKFEKSISVGSLIDQWDEIFENDALSLIGKSHRPLVARWLKWTILIHDLRETLAQYTSIGVTGLVNSGKSLLVKELFKIQSVKVGTRAVKRTTVPLLYNLEDSIDGLDVIDFPGVDDTDQTVPELADLLLSIAQIVVFVVDFRRCFTAPVKAWLQALTKNGVALHICLTHADLLYSECKKEGKLGSIAGELKRIQDHFNLDSHRARDVTFYSFDHPSDVSTKELKEYGINSVVDVGDWLVRVLKHTFKQDTLAEKLKHFLQL